MHPNDHVNASQSTNDVYPTALRVELIGTGVVYTATAPQIVVLALLALIFFAAASTAFLRKDVR